MEHRKRNEQITLRLTPQEKEMLIERQKFCGITTVNQYIREMAIDGCILVVDHSDLKKQNYELSQIGNNIRQIAKKVNATGNLYANEMNELKEMMDQIWQLQKSNLSDLL